jgi:hypothetical protein
MTGTNADPSAAVKAELTDVGPHWKQEEFNRVTRPVARHRDG